MDRLADNASTEDIIEFLKDWITKIPRYIKHDHGPCIVNLNKFITNFKPIIVEKTPDYIHIQWKLYDIIKIELRIMKDSIAIKDYTYIIPPYYECCIKA
jgi:hypothetical protein